MCNKMHDFCIWNLREKYFKIYPCFLWLKCNLKCDGKLDSHMFLNKQFRTWEVYTYQCSTFRNILWDNRKRKKKNDKKGIEKEVSLDVYEWFSGTLDKIKHTSANITIFVAIV